MLECLRRVQPSLRSSFHPLSPRLDVGSLPFLRSRSQGLRFQLGAVPPIVRNFAPYTERPSGDWRHFLLMLPAPEL